MILLLLSAPGLSATLTVGSGGYATISAAVSAAADGDTLAIDAGTYAECVSLAGKDLTLQGAGAGSTLLTGDGSCDVALAMDLGETATVADLTLDNPAGQGFTVQGGTVVLSNVTVQNGGDPMLRGGGGSVTDADLTLDGCTFQDNQAQVGGHLAATGSHLAISNSTFSGGSSLYGGALYVASALSLEVTDSTFTGNQSTTSGGVLVTDTVTSVTFSGTTFEDNAAKESGGVFYAYNTGTITWTDSTFQGNTAGGYGGVGYCPTASLTISGCTFEDNQSTSTNGGAVVVTNGDLQVDDSSFSSNQAASHGGALMVFQGSLIGSNLSFEGNTSSTGYGGAIYVNGIGGSYGLSLSDVSFEANSAGGTGGGLYGQSLAEVVLQGARFASNSANAGGALGFTYVASTSVTGNTFCANTAANGGAAYVANYSTASTIDVWSNNLLQDNTASENGGGIYVAVDHKLDWINNTLVGQEAGGLGGAIYIDNAGLNATNNLIAWTAAGDGLSVSADAYPVTLQYNDWYGNTDVDAGAGTGLILGDNGNIADDPGVVAYSDDGDCTNDDLGLADGSALIDAGDPGLLDVDGSISDIGANGGPGGSSPDDDADGVVNNKDCADADAAIFPGAAEICDGIDNDCDGLVDLDDDGLDDGIVTCWADGDGDGYGAGEGLQRCEISATCVAQDGDCDDADPLVVPGAAEGIGDAIDQDCDGGELCYQDGDGDGYRPDEETTVASSDLSCDGAGEASPTDPTGDCDDADPSVYPGAADPDLDCAADRDPGDGPKPEEACTCAASGEGAPLWAGVLLLAAVARRRQPGLRRSRARASARP